MTELGDMSEVRMSWSSIRTQGIGVLALLPLPHRKCDCHALPHCCEHGAARDAGEGVQRAMDACLVSSKGYTLNPGGKGQGAP